MVAEAASNDRPKGMPTGWKTRGGAPPVVWRVVDGKATFTVPIGSDGGAVMLGGGGGFTAIVNCFVAVNNASVTWTVNVKLPVGVGAPVTLPVEELMLRLGIVPP